VARELEEERKVADNLAAPKVPTSKGVVSRLVLDIYIFIFSSLAGISSICKISKIFGGIERHFRAKKRALNGTSVLKREH
jgi:hypothetical protein